MKYPGNLFGLMIGAVDQETYLPVGAMFNFRCQMAKTKRSAKAFDDTNNFSGGAESEVTTNRRLVITVSDFMDDQNNFLDTPLVMEEGDLFRLAICPISTAGLIDTDVPGLCFLCPVVRLADGDWNPNSLEGQNTELVFNTVRHWHNPGSNRPASLAVKEAWSWI